MIPIKTKKQLCCIFSAVIIILLVISALCISAFAKMSDMLPVDTNIPAPDIGGATGMDESAPIGTAFQSMLEGKVNPEPSTSESRESTDTMSKALGIVVAVIVVLAVIVLLIALIPRRERYSEDKKE